MRKFSILFMFAILASLFANAQSFKATNLIEQPFFQRITSNQGLSQGTINCIIQDRQGFMWFGTMDGLNRYDGYEMKVFRSQPNDTNSISSNVINQIIEDKKGILWIATDNGLNAYNPYLNTFTKVDLKTASPAGKITVVYCMTIDLSGQLWLGTLDNGIICFNPESSEQKQYLVEPKSPDGLITNSIRAIFADSNDQIWFGSQSGGISILETATGLFTHYIKYPGIQEFQPEINFINTFAETADHKILIGGQGVSLIIYDPATKKFEKRNLPNSLIGAEGVSLRAFSLSNNMLWMGNDGCGLMALNLKNADYSVYTQGNSIHSLLYNSIKSLYTDREGNLWIGTYGKGVNVFSPYYKPFYSFIQQNENQMGLSFSSVRAIYEDDDGIIWVGGYDDVNKIDLNKGITSVTKNIVAYSFCPDPKDSNILWLGTEGAGLHKINKKTNEYYKFPVNRAPSETTVRGSGVFRIVKDDKGHMYFGTEYGLNILNLNTGKFSYFGNDPSDNLSIIPGHIVSIFIDHKNDLWVGSIQGGIAKFNPEKGTFKQFMPDPNIPESISGSRVYCIYEDSKNRFWIGTNMGLNLMERETGKCNVFNESNGLANNVIYGILDDKYGNLWLSTNQGLAKFEPELNKFTNYNINDGLPGNEFNTGAHFKKDDNRLYFGGVDGLVVFNPNKILANPIPPNVIFTRFLKSGHEFKTDTVISYLKTATLNPDDHMVSFEFSALTYTNANRCQYAYMVDNLSDEWINLNNNRTVVLANLSPGEYILRVKASNNDGVWSENPTSIKIIVLPKFYETTWFKLLIAILLIGIIVTVFILRIRLIRKQNERLEQLVASKTHELKEAIDELADEIEERKKTSAELQEANTTKDKFFSIIAHDLRSPFNTLLGFSDLLVEQWKDLEDDEKLEFIERIKKTSENTYNLVNNLLEWSRLQKGTIEYNPVKTNLKYLSKISTEQLQAGIDLKEIALSLDIPGFINAFADQNMIDFVFRNLISNAIKFTPRLGQISISAKIHDNRVICQVEDTGIGMTHETIEGLFKLENTISSKGTEGETGTGLGLILCKEFLKKNRGSIWVESAPGKGSKFFFSLPVSEHY